jgi:hypothetical protein
MMDSYMIDYILSYYSRFETQIEKAAMIHHEAIEQLRFRNLSSDSLIFQMLNKRISTDNNVLQLLENGYELFRSQTAKRIFNEHKNKIYFNYCPNCKKIARTPQAKQCRFCYHSWHDKVVATFQIASAFELHNKRFYILGDLLSGKIKIGNVIDLTILGLATKPKVTGIEFALHTNEEDRWEDTGLCIDYLSEDDKEFIISQSPFLSPVLIEQ